MKKAAAVLLILALAVFMSVPVFAEPVGTVGKFSPTLDGIKDEAYNQSFSFNIFDQENTERGEGWWSTHGNQETDVDATIYYLWDDKFLYAFIEVILADVKNIGDEHILTHDNPWEANSIELWILWDDLYNGGDRLKTSVEPFHNREWGDGPFYDDVAPNGKAIAVMTDKGYNAEFQIAIPSEFLKDGSQMRATLQVNVFDGEGSIPVGLQIQGDPDLASLLTLGAPIAIAVSEPEPVADDTAMGGGDENENVHVEAPLVIAPPPPAEIPPTGDASILAMLVLFIASCFALSVLKKRRI